MAPLRVMICGGGIAGPSLAFWLSRIGCVVTIVERSSELRADGQQIDIRAQGVQAMRKMGIEEAIRAKVVHEPGVEFLDSTGKRQAYFAVNDTGTGKQSLTSEYEIMRGDMCRILYDATKENVRYLFATHVVSFDQDGGDGVVRVRLSDGTEAAVDLLVGADGQNSKLRGLMLDPDVPDPFHRINLNLAWVTIPAQEGDSNVCRGYHAPGRRFIATRMNKPGALHLYLFAAGTDLADDHPLKTTLQIVGDGNAAAQKHAWADHFRDAGWQSERFARDLVLPAADDWYACEAGQVKLASWSRGRVALLGDAAYCPSPVTGMGTASALVGAYVLAGEMARHCKLGVGAGDSGDGGAARPQDGLDAALKAYEERLRPYVSKVQELPPGVPNLWMPDSSWGIYLLNTVFWLIEKLRIDKLASKLGSDEVGGWDLPEYPELGS